MTTPPLSFFVRGPDGLSLLVGPPFDTEPTAQLLKIPCKAAVFSHDGEMLAVISEKVLSIYDTRDGSIIRSLEVVGIKAAAFSPKGTFLQTFEPPSQSQKNVTIWNVATGTSVFQQSKKTFSKEAWPIIQFSEDETVVCYTVTNEVHFLDPKNFTGGTVDRLRIPGINIAQLAASPPTHVAAYVPESKGSPASVRIYERKSVAQSDPVARRSFYRSSTARLLWNVGSTGLLVLAQSDVDKSNQSYFGEVRLHYLRSDGSHEGSVPLSKEGPVHDVEWCPSGREFLVVYGFMPACATLYDDRCRILHNFKSGPYNTVRWNSHGRFFCLAGFGSLPGDMTFWDRTSLSCLGNTKAECSVTCEWSADGRYVLTATTAPRLQVDNGIKVFRYDGSLYFEKKYEKLFQAEWRPAAVGIYEDRPASPHAVDDKRKDKVGTATKVVANKSTVTAKPTAYVTPHAKAAAAIRSQLLGEEPSGSELSKNASKNKKRREKQREKKDAAVLVGLSNEDVSSLENQMGTLPTLSDSNADTAVNDVGKKLRTLYKKIRQIEEIKEKMLEGRSIYPLDSAQKEKLSQEAAIREEIRTLEAQK